MGKVSFEGIVFSGRTPMIDGCLSDLCSYCPFTIFSGASVLDDRGSELIEGSNTPQSVCNTFQTLSFITMDPNSALTLINITFVNFKEEFRSLISMTNGTLILQDVNFQNITVNQSVILQTGSDFSTEISMVGGMVEQLNNGYEYLSGTVYAGFISSTSAKQILINSVVFQYNLLGLAGILLSVSNFLSLQITNSQFYYNLGGIVRVMSSIILPTDLTHNNSLSYYSLTHFALINSTFTGNSAASLVNVSWSVEILNIEVSNCAFLNCLSTTSGFVSFICIRQPSQREVNGAVLTVLNSGVRDKVTFPKMWTQISNLTFNGSSAYGDGLLLIQNLPNVVLQGIQITGSGDIGPNQQLNSITLQAMIQYPGMYISKLAANMVVQSCRSLIHLESIYSLTILQSTFASNICMNGSSGIIATNLYEATYISTLDFSSNSGSSSKFGTILDLIFSGNATLQGLSVYGTSNKDSTGSAIVKLTSSSTPVFLTDSSFSYNLPPSGSLLCIGSFDIRNTKFISNVSGGLTAAGLVYNPLFTAAQLSLTSVTFKDNVSFIGAALTIDETLNVAVPIQLTIKSSTFDSNISQVQGSCIIITNAVKLTDSSLISQSLFVNNTAPSACILNSFQSGILVIDESVFRNNTAAFYAIIYANHPRSTLLAASRIILRNSLLEYNSGLFDVGIENENFFSEGESYNLTYQFNFGYGVYIQYGYWKDSGSLFRNNESPGVSCTMAFRGYSQAEVFNTTFLSNFSPNSAGASFIGVGSSVNFTLCSFIENVALGQGGAIFVDTDSSLYMHSCIFIRNRSLLEGSAIYFVVGSLLVTQTFINTTFIDNESGKAGTISIVSTSVAIQSCNFSGNKAPDSSGLLIYVSQVNISDSYFYDQSASKGAFIYLSAASTVNVLRTQFLNGKASQGGGIYAIASNLTVSQSRFKNLMATMGSAIVLNANSYFMIEGCEFESLAASQKGGGVVYSLKSAGSIIGSVFHSFTNGAIVGVSSNVNISQSLFYGECYLDGNSSSGTALSCTECLGVDVEDTVCRGLQASFAACFLLQVVSSQVQYTFHNCTIDSNLGQEMGAVVLSNVNAQITNSQFINNSAILSITSGDGGGIYFTCPTATECILNMSDSSFVNNTASHNGGGIAWTDYKPILNNVSFSGNSGLYGTDISSYAIKLAPSSSRRLYELSGIPSGQVAPEPISVSLLDHYNQVVTTDNSSIAQLQPRSSNTSLSRVTRIAAVSGTFVFSAYQITATPGKSTAITVQTNGIDLNKPPNNSTISSFLLIPVQMRNCTIGESLMLDMCYVCPIGLYSLDPGKSCNNCPIGAICLGNYTMIPMSGYWRSQLTSSKFWECPNPDSCLGSSTDPQTISLTGDCANGYFGNMCNGCISGFSRSSIAKCSICPDNTVNIILIIGIVILAALIIIFIIKMSLVSAHTSRSQLSIYLKVFINYLQLITIISTFSLTWPSYILDMFKYQQNVGDISEQVFDIDCFLDNGRKDNQQKVMFLKITIVACIPVMFTILSAFFWSGMALIRHCSQYMKRQFINSIVVMFFITHPSIAYLMFEMLNCKEIDPGEYWVTSYLNIRCWEGDHMRYAMTVAIPSIILWGIFTPAVACIVLVRYRTSLDQENSLIRFGFLYTGYQMSWYYWEFVILYRKLILIVISVFLTNVSIPIQALCVMIVLIGSFLLQTKEKPYYTPMLNSLELRGILVAGVSIYCGLFYLNTDLSNTSQVLLFLVMICANVYFLVYWLVQVCPRGYLLLIEWQPRFQVCLSLRKRRVLPEHHISNISSVTVIQNQPQDISRKFSSSASKVIGDGDFDISEVSQGVQGSASIPIDPENSMISGELENIQ